MTANTINVVCLAGLVALCAASEAQAQTIPRTADFGAQLPSIPLTSPVDATQITLEAISGMGGRGITVAPGVVVDRLVRPRCVFVANQNTGGGSVRQTADIGNLQIYCP